MNRALIYVALTRAKSLDGLSIVITGSKFPLFETICASKDSKSNNLVDAEISRLRNNILKTEWEWLYWKTGKKIISHNIQSFEAHRKIIDSDEMFKSSDLLILTETWLHCDPTDLGNWEIKGSSHCESDERAKGIIILAKEGTKINIIKSKRYYHQKKSIDLLALQYHDIDIITVYKQCAMSTKTMIDILNQFEDDFLGDSKNSRIIIGDFNTDFNKTDKLEVTPPDQWIQSSSFLQVLWSQD